MKLIATLLLLLPLHTVAAEKLTADQQAEFERLFDERAATLRAQIIDEIKRDPSLICDAAATKSSEKKQENEMKSAATIAVDDETQRKVDPHLLEYSGNLSEAPVPLDRGFSGEKPGGRTFKAAIEFNAGSGRASMKLSDTKEDVVGSSSLRGRAASTDIIVSAPIDDKENDFANFATLDGLSSGIKFEYTRSLRYVDITRSLRKIAGPEFDRWCKKYVRDGDNNCAQSDILLAIDGNDRELLEFKKQFYPWAIEYAYGVEASYNDFDYLTPGIQKESKSHAGYGATFSVGFLAPSRETLYAMGAQYQRAHRAGKTAIVCPPIGASPTVICASGALGPPARTTVKNLWGEVRGSARNYGYSLRLTHDLDSDDTGVDLPIYLIKNPKGAWSGGIRLGWTKEEDFGFGIFLSAPFDLK